MLIEVWFQWTPLCNYTDGMKLLCFSNCGLLTDAANFAYVTRTNERARRNSQMSIFIWSRGGVVWQSLGRSPKNWSRSKIKIKWNDLQDQDQRSFLKWSCQIKIICMILADQDQDHGLSIYCDLDLFSERSPLLDQWKWSFRSRSFLQINKSDLCTQRSKIISKDLIFCTKDQWSSQALYQSYCVYINS